MGLNPGAYAEQRVQDLLDDMFHPGESPYFKMHSAGKCGIPLDKVIEKVTSLGIPIRAKDIEAWQDGAFKYQASLDPSFVIPKKQYTSTGVGLEEAKLSDFPMYPQSWVPPKKRFFPCTEDNRPMQKWGWSKEYHPILHDYQTARSLSPVNWVGQNMLYQRFIVLDIDGRGHGEEDLQSITWGSQFRNSTLCLEDPTKPGSFHLYFSTDRIIPVRHFPWAKIDLMGNAVNAAVYLKNKQHNGLSMMQLTEQVWQSLMSYQQQRKGERS